jgi:1-phosphofructokinase
MIASVTLNPAVDYTVELPETLATGTVTRASGHRYDAGGKGINVSKYLVGLGVDTVATGVAGGFLGRYLLDQLSARGIAAEFVSVGGETRLNTTVLGPTGEYKINQSGPHVPPTAVEALLEQLHELDPDRVVIAGSLPPGCNPETIDLLAEAGCWEAVVDVDGATLSALETEYALCKPNVEELAAATGCQIEDVPSALDAARRLRDQGFDSVVASLGSEGAVMATPDGSLHAPAKAVEVVDTVGAGDALLAGVLASCSRGDANADALRHGIAVASRVVSVSGTRAPSLAGVQDDKESITVSTY